MEASVSQTSPDEVKPSANVLPTVFAATIAYPRTNIYCAKLPPILACPPAIETAGNSGETSGTSATLGIIRLTTTGLPRVTTFPGATAGLALGIPKEVFASGPHGQSPARGFVLLTSE
jgi:hypothetical protein